MNWALSQRLETHQQQILLYVIADSADPNGVTRHCDAEYMVQHARMSRATVFRRLAEMEELQLFFRRKYYTESGVPRYEITLNLEALVNKPIRGRRKGDDEDEGGDPPPPDGSGEAWDGEDNGATPESQAETLVEEPKSHGSETGAVAPVRQAQSHSCDDISPPLSKSLPPNPPPGGSLSKGELQQSEKRSANWDRFAQGYPGITTMDQQAARAELDELSLDDAEWAVGVLPALKEELRKLGRPPKNAHIWLRKAMFRNFTRTKIEPPPPDEVWIADGSDEDRALRFVRRLAKVPNRFVKTQPDGGRGYSHKSEVGPDLLAMLTVESAVVFRWTGYPRGSPEFAAWQTRFQQWIGAPLPTESGTDCIRVPWQWPPSKTGKIYGDGEEPTIEGSST